jgi:hypothetical protein
MSIIERFVAYAADFEKTLADDDWSRLGQYFSKDAVYRVESDLFGCELTGPDRIFAGMKKSLDGFDRNFPEREIAMTKGPDVEGDEMRVSWTIRDDKIVLLVDSYDERINAEVANWMQETGLKLDPSYT